MSRVFNATQGFVADFRNPRDRLTIDAGPGNDTLSLQPLDSNQFSTIALTGDGTDTIRMQGGTLDSNVGNAMQIVLETGESLRLDRCAIRP